jgi:hypothetical protein
MAFDLSDCQFQGPALPEPFVKLELEKELARLKVLPKTTGPEGKELAAQWEVYRRKLRELGAAGGSLRVRHHVIEPVQALLGYARIELAGDVQTREDLESGGALLLSGDEKAKFRIWTTSFNEDLYAPSKRGRAYRYSHLRVAQRVLLASGERMGLVTNGVQLLVLISDPARPDSTVSLPLDSVWKRSRDVPDSFRLLMALACPKGVAAVADLVEKARLQQARVTKELRKQAREAVEHFIQEILDHPANQEWLKGQGDHLALARTLWREGLVTIYRLLFILKLEASDDPARSFSFASTSLWRNTFSPSMALARYAHDVLERGLETGTLLEAGLRAVFRMFEQGLECTELVVKPLGGALFGSTAAPTLSQLTWGERAVAWLLDRLLWTPQRRGEATRQRVHYGPLDVEDLGRVYEALLELEPGITHEPMCRLRRQKLEVVVPLAQGEKYRPKGAVADSELEDGETEEPAEEEAEEEEQPARGKKTKVQWIEAIAPGRFYLRVGLGRKASGSYYTPHSFVRFLVQETLGPQVAERSPPDDPQPLKILQLKVLDPAMGSGHFLVEACRFLGDKLYEACRLCDDKALAAERAAEKATKAERQKALEESARWRQRILDLPDPDDQLVKYLPSRSPEGEESGFSQQRAEAMCRRQVVTHCLYGVDKNPLAVELAKLALWLESHAEGMPLTFVDHRLVVGDSLTGPFWEKLIFRPGNPKEPIDKLFYHDLDKKLRQSLHEAIRYVHRLEASVGITVAEMREKEAVKESLDGALLPFRVAGAAWSGGVMLGPESCDDYAYAELLQTIGNSGNLPKRMASERLRAMIARGLGIGEAPPEREALCAVITSGRCLWALSYDLTFPEVFYPTGVPHARQGFHVVLGNPPWDAIQFKSKEFFAAFDFDILNAPTKRERESIERRLVNDPACGPLFERYKEDFEQQKRVNDVLYEYQKVYIEGDLAGRQGDAFRIFMERNAQLLARTGWTGVVVPSAFHANEGATGVRRLYLEKHNLRYCYSFENRRLLFEIHRSFKFATVVVQAGKPTEEVSCAFYLHDDEWLFGERGERELKYDLPFVKRTGGEYLTLLEPKTDREKELLNRMLSSEVTIGLLLSDWRITPNTSELPMLGGDTFKPLNSVGLTGKDPRDPDVTASLIARGLAPLHEGKTFFQFDDRFGDAIRYVASLQSLCDRPRWLLLCRYYRIAYRAIARSTDERTAIATILPPGTVSTRKAASDVTPAEHPLWRSLWLAGLFNSFPLDFGLRSMVQIDVGLFIVKRLPVPLQFRPRDLFITHAALRLTCNHAGYAPLWKEQVSETWREVGKKPLTWPILAEDEERWAVRAAIDAVVADAYGLSREQYAHVLSSFSHARYKKAPELCLTRFDELRQMGLEAFTKKHDPYWDIPLNENLPKPVIDLPIPDGQEPLPLLAQHAQPKKRGRKKASP